jgi:two-component system cell cycle sensor histidine kinase/response regulator CckA
VALVYVLAGILWMALSDWLLLRTFPERPALGQKTIGLLFVLLSGLLIHLLVRRELRKRQALEEEREQLHRRLAGSQRLEALGRLTGGIAHDFNNLLTAIGGGLDSFLIRARANGSRETDVRELVEAASAAERAAQLTTQLLAFGRRQKLKPEAVDIGVVVEDMAQLLHRLIGDQIRVRMSLPPNLWLVDVDPGPLQQVVMNLAINARDAMPDGGDLSLTTSNVSIDAGLARDRFAFPFEPGDYVLLQVGDSGVGMTAVTRAHIFEPFFTTKDKDIGTGLGLSTVFGIVKQSGGYIDVETAPGEGTRFDIYFPRSRVEAPRREATTPATNGKSAGSETVLVVEDEDAVRSLIVRTLERRGFDTVEAPDGSAGLATIQTLDRPVHLLLTDAVLPGLSGPELIAAARQLDPAIRVILMSGYAANQFTPGVPYLSKPFSPGQLAARVRQVLDEEPGVPPTSRSDTIQA